MEVDGKSHLAPSSPASLLIHEYHGRKLMVELGYEGGKLDDLDDFSAIVFIKIAGTYNYEQDKLMKNKVPKGK